MLTPSRVTAVLGPTNTGKTHYAIERMLGHRTGVIGLPLRLLAREVYDRIVKARGPSVAALVTGEERIVGERAAYWVCTVEAMPVDIGADFLAVDEIQLCADPDRGHIFTDRLLNARGLVETMFLGSEAMRGAIAALVPHVQFMRRERFSTLSWSGSKKISRMPARSAIVGFSVENVYAMAEVIRRMKGGAAVVMGALSPRTRNAQVDLYQNGEVDYLVATDAIGMGLNLDIRHVAFSATDKFDGRRMRPLFPHEMGQIAGRAGRHLTPGTFGVTGEAGLLDDELIEAIENHRFAPVRRLFWRNGELDFGTAARLVASLEAPTANEWLIRAREADDQIALKTLMEMPEVAARLTGPQAVRRLWDVCRVPDFRGLGTHDHATLLARLFGFLSDGQIPSDWIATAIARIDRTDGDIDTLSKRLAFIRTWTYVAQRAGWVADEPHWRGETRAVEDRLSDALHAALTRAFVDRRTSVLLRRLKQKESLVAEVNDKGEVTVEGQPAGRLEGFRFRQDATGSPDEARVLRQAAEQALRPEFHLRADRFYNAPDTELDYTEQGGLMWGTTAVGKLVKGGDALRPAVEPFVDDEAGPDVAEKVRRRLQHFIDRKVASLFEPLLALQKDEAVTGLARGVAFRLVEAMGVLPRADVAEDVKALDQEARAALRKNGVRFGQYTIFQQALLKPAPTRLRLVLWSLWAGLSEFPESPPPGLVTIPNLREVPRGHYTLSGYHPAGARAIRIDMLERLADLLRAKDSRAGFEAMPEMLSITGMTMDQFADLMGGLGYRAEKAERPKVRPEAAAAATGLPATEAPAEAGAADVPPDAAPAEPAQPAAPEAASEGPQAAAVEEPEAAAPVEMEAFYTFTWAPRPRGDARRGGQGRGQGEGAEGGTGGGGNRGRGDRPRGDRKPQGGRPPRGDAAPAPQPAAAEAGPAEPAARPEGEGGRGPRHQHGGKPHGGGQGKHGGKPGGKGGKPDHRPRDGRPKVHEARPPRPEKPIDPDNPFAVLAALKGRL
ncbi:MAG: helicase [Paracoccaceae bacterium]|nr:MAG: helicase [Paracoccaceae bacterium]